MLMVQDKCSVCSFTRASGCAHACVCVCIRAALHLCETLCTLYLRMCACTCGSSARVKDVMAECYRVASAHVHSLCLRGGCAAADIDLLRVAGLTQPSSTS